MLGVEEVDGGLLDFHPAEVRARQQMQRNAQTSVLVLDRSKFQRNAHVRGGHISEATKVFCDERPPEAIVDMLRASSTELIICDGGQAS